MGDLKSEFKRLVDFFNPNPKPSTEFAKRFLTDMTRFEMQYVHEAVDYIESNFNRLPSIAQMIAVVDSIRSNDQETKAEAERRENQRHEWLKATKGDTFGNQCKQLIDELFTRRITRGMFLSRSEALGIDMSQTRAYYNRHRLDLSECCRGFEWMEDD